MQVKLGLVTLLVVVGVSTGTQAFEGKLTAKFDAGSDQGPTTLTYYDASCVPGEAPECAVTYLWCDSPRDIGFEVLGVTNEVLGKWLVKDGARATLTSEKHLLRLSPTEMITNEMTGGWDLKFNAVSTKGGEDAEMWFAGLEAVPKITIRTAKGDDVLPTEGDNGKQLSLFLAACRTVGR